MLDPCPWSVAISREGESKIPSAKPVTIESWFANCYHQGYNHEDSPGNVKECEKIKDSWRYGQRKIAVEETYPIQGSESQHQKMSPGLGSSHWCNKELR